MVRYVANVSFRKAIPHTVIRAASAGTASFEFYMPNAKPAADIGDMPCVQAQRTNGT